MRTYVTPVELNRYDPNIPDICTKCTEDRGTLFHCFWQCRIIIIYILKAKQHTFEGIWKPFIEYVRNSDLMENQTDD